MKQKNIKSSKSDNNYGKWLGVSDSSQKLVLELLTPSGVIKKPLVDYILECVYGSKKTRLCLKKQEPYFYNAISEAIKLSYKLGADLQDSLHKEKK